ncbi:zinc finger MYND domain-containing protein 10 [Macrobrachium rosenbergii]|uniref:zinc finger MYND domain-containing protein 10 n=1 Tax=Macrobrachium rosenbergii TaxID=79674 RepID=UPI0034D3DCCB
MASVCGTLLKPFEIDNYVENLECIPIEGMFTERWVKQSCRLIQLSVEVGLETSQRREEYVQRSITLHNKGLVTIWHLLMGESWRLHLLPLVWKHGTPPASSLPLMLVLQTESAALTILESLVFHEESAEVLDALVLDIIDYCVRQLTFLTSYVQYHEGPPYTPEEAFKVAEGAQSNCKSAESGEETVNTIQGEVSGEKNRLGMALACRSVAVIQLLTACRSKLPLCAMTSLLQTHDVPQLLATLLQLTPWKTIHKDTAYDFQDGQWVPEKVTESSGPVNRIEGQIWVTLYTLLMDQETLSMYELSRGRRAALLKIQGKLNEAVLSHLPVLEPFAKWLSALALTTPQQARQPPLVTTVRQLGDGVVSHWTGRWQELFQILAPRCLSPSQGSLSTLATSMSAAWNLEALEALLPDIPVCAVCGSPAGRRCSRCRMQWYCRRECQVKHWPTHQSLCDVISAVPSKGETNVIE